jgi:hypothetical protein
MAFKCRSNQFRPNSQDTLRSLGTCLGYLKGHKHILKGKHSKAVRSFTCTISRLNYPLLSVPSTTARESSFHETPPTVAEFLSLEFLIPLIFSTPLVYYAWRPNTLLVAFAYKRFNTYLKRGSIP